MKNMSLESELEGEVIECVQAPLQTVSFTVQKNMN